MVNELGLKPRKLMCDGCSFRKVLFLSSNSGKLLCIDCLKEEKRVLEQDNQIIIVEVLYKPIMTAFFAIIAILSLLLFLAD